MHDLNISSFHTGLENVRVAITGASRGLGLALGSALWEAGATVAGCARGDAKEACPFSLYRADVTNPLQIRQWVQFLEVEWGGVDVLINNAGISTEQKALSEHTLDSVQKVFETNVLGPFLCANEFHKLLRAGNHPLIINVGSKAGSSPRLGLAPYAISKAALTSLTQSQHLELSPIQAIEIQPGRIGTTLRQHSYGDAKSIREGDLEAFIAEVVLAIKLKHRPIEALNSAKTPASP